MNFFGVGITPDDEFVFYDVVDIIPTTFALKNEPDAPSIVTTNESPDDKPGASASTARVPQDDPAVKTQKSNRDVGYHAGDLGKSRSDSYWKMGGRGRYQE